MSDEGLQFEKAEFSEGTAQAAVCGFCQEPLRHRYWTVGGKAACFKCQKAAATRGTEGSGLGRFVRAAVFGSGAGAVGAAVWYGIRAVTDLEIGLISIFVGIGVGLAVKAGSRGRGGPLYQALAVFLTYTAICSTYVPYILEAVMKGASEEAAPEAGATDASSSPAPAPVSAEPAAVPTSAPRAEATPGEPPTPGQMALALVLFPILIMAFAYAAPFLQGWQSLLAIFIIGIGVYEAWKINRRETLDIGGPFAVAPAAAGGPPPLPPEAADPTSAGG